MLKAFLITSLLLLAAPHKPAIKAVQVDGDAILGKWTSEDQKLVVEMYRSGEEYRGKMVWFKDDEGKPMNEWTDKHNPDEKLRGRKLLGMDVVTGLKYDREDKSYDEGHIYEAKSGKTWNATAKLAGNDVLKVKGYWHVKFIGRTMIFKRMK